MNFIHDIIKIHLSKLGYLPDTPYHLISDAEMCDAFIQEDTDNVLYFYDYYPCVDDALQEDYNKLVQAILYHIDQFKKSTLDNPVLPNWVYSYMLGAVIGPSSDPLDIHDLILPLGVDNIDDEFNGRCAAACLEASKKWLMKLRRVRVTLPDGTILDTRPPTIFGEPHVVKYVRLSDLRPYQS
jgi:hypothetical protein